MVSKRREETLSGMQWEEMSPDELAAVREGVPVAYVPLGTLEFHGWHLPLGFDAIKAHELCLRLCERTGGVVLPPLYFGAGGGHKAYDGTIMAEEDQVAPLLRLAFQRLHEHGFRVIVAITGHYPGEQVRMLKQAALEHMEAGGAQVIALPEYEAYTAERRADHAAKWETSIMLALRPDLVHLERLEGHPHDPLYGIYGEDPRNARAELGRETVEGIVQELVRRVEQALAKP